MGTSAETATAIATATATAIATDELDGLGELDKILALAASSPKPRNNAKQGKSWDTIDQIREFRGKQNKLIKYKLLRGARVWVQITCKNCGKLVSLTFQRSMELWSYNGVENWRTGEKFNKDLSSDLIEDAVIERFVPYCDQCMEVPAVFKPFKQVFGVNTPEEKVDGPTEECD